MKFLLLLIFLAQLSDLVTFAAVITTVGIENELNPILRSGYEQYGLSIVIALKVAAIVAMIAAASKVTVFKKRLGAVAVGVFLGILGAFSNISSLFVIL